VTDSPWMDVQHLLVARLDNAGDVLMCRPALSSLRQALPAAQVCLWASPGGAEVAPLLPEVDETLVTRSLWQDLGRLPFDPQRERDLVQTLADGHFDAAIIFTSFAQSPHAAAYAAYLAGVPLRAGQSREFAGRVLTDAVPPLDDQAHQVDRNLHLVQALGFPAVAPTLGVAIPTGAHDSLGLLLHLHGINHGRPFVVLHPGASCPSRRYPLPRFADVGRSLVKATGWPVVITGAERDRALATALRDEIGSGAISLAGETSLAEFAALVSRATAVVTNNTLTMHLADAVGTPEVVLFAGTEREEQWQPRQTPARLLRRPTACRPCYRFDCPYGLPCLDLPPAEVVAAVLNLVSLGVS
jgi:ADP-heptose:LPS heptosyltransferase